MVSCISENQKTIRSFDTTTRCKRVREGNPCAYCYVVSARNIGCRGKIEADYLPYTGEVLRMGKDLVKKLNKVGGIRVFSFGDYMPEHAEDIKRFLDDCSKRKLHVKVITKETSFIRDFHNHPAIKVIHLSVDGLQGDIGRSPITLRNAQKYRAKYEKVLIRAVCLNDSEIDTFGRKPTVDIITLNHGKKLSVANTYYKHEDVVKTAVKFPDKVCCASKNCENCKIRCGLDKDGKLFKNKLQDKPNKLTLDPEMAQDIIKK